MNNRSNNQIRMIRATNGILLIYAGTYVGFIKFKNYAEQIQDIIDEIDRLLDILVGLDIGPAKQKEILRLAMVDAALIAASSGFSYADDEENAVLKEKMNINKSNFDHLAENEQGSLAMMIYNELNPIIADLADYNLDATKMTDLQQKTTKYKNYLNAPRATITLGAETREAIEAQVKLAMATFVKMDKLMDHYKDSAFEFYTMYFNNRKILDLGHRYKEPICYLSGTVTNFNGGGLMKDVKVYLKEFEKKAVKTDGFGKYSLGLYQEGEQIAVYEKDGFTTVEKTLVVVKGENLQIDVVMKEVE